MRFCNQYKIVSGSFFYRILKYDIKPIANLCNLNFKVNEIFVWKFSASRFLSNRRIFHFAWVSEWYTHDTRKKVHKTVEKISSKLLWRDHGFISLLHHLPVDMQTPILNSRLDTEQFEFELENKFTGSLNVKNVIIRKFTSILHSMHR